jgi:hypothetical protein
MVVVVLVFPAVLRVSGLALRDFLFVAVAHGQQHVLGEVQVAALFAVVFEDVGLHDRIDRAAFFAEAAEDALGQVDVVARGAACAVGTLVRLDRDRQRRAHGLAQLAGDATLFAVVIAAQRMQAPEARRQRRLLFRELNGDLAGEHVLPGDRHALEKLQQREAGDEVLQRERRRPRQGLSVGAHGYFQML